MKTEIIVRGEDAPDLTRDLFVRLVEEPELRGRVRLLTREPPPYALGPVAEALEAALGPGGCITVVTTVAIAWLRYHASKATIIFKTEDQELELTFERVKGLDADALERLTLQISRALADGGELDARN